MFYLVKSRGGKAYNPERPRPYVNNPTKPFVKPATAGPVQQTGKDGAKANPSLATKGAGNTLKRPFDVVTKAGTSPRGRGMARGRGVRGRGQFFVAQRGVGRGFVSPRGRGRLYLYDIFC